MNVRKNTLAVLGATVVCIGVQGGMVQAGERGFLPYGNADAVARGAQIYEENCASCHGAALEGQANWRQPGVDGRLPAPPHDPSGHTWHHSDMVLFRLTKFGPAAVVGNGYESNMPGFDGTLSDWEIAEVLAYIKSTWPERIIEAHNARN